MAKVPGEIVKRDRFILCTFPLTFRGAPLVLDSSDSLGEVLSSIAGHSDGEERLSVCEVVDGKWRLDPRDPSECTPVKVRTLYQIEQYDAVSDD